MAGVVFKMYEWQSPTGEWHCSNVQDLGHHSSAWWVPARILGLSLTDYIIMLKEKYHASKFYFKDGCGKDKNESILLFTFEEYKDCHRFFLDINRISRNKKIMI